MFGFVWFHSKVRLESRNLAGGNGRGLGATCSLAEAGGELELVGALAGSVREQSSIS